MNDALLNLFFGKLPRVIARSLRDEPQRWRRDSDDNRFLEKTYELRHESGARVWVANGSQGLDVKVPGCKVWGGVTFASASGLSPGHHLIWAAAKPLTMRQRASLRAAERFVALGGGQ